MGSRSYIFNILHKDLHKKLRNFGIFFSTYWKRKFLSYSVFLSAQFHLYRALCRLGNFNPPTYRAETGRTISGRRFGAFDFVVYLSLSKILYILAAGCNKIPVVSILSANAVCTHACTADRNVSGQAR